VHPHDPLHAWVTTELAPEQDALHSLSPHFMATAGQLVPVQVSLQGPSALQRIVRLLQPPLSQTISHPNGPMQLIERPLH